MLKLIVENAFGVAAGVFSGLFMLIVSWYFFKGMRKVDLTSLFMEDNNSRKVSSTKFWSSIAYFVATIAFLTINFMAPGSAGLEFIWAIYMSTVAGHAALSKFITAKYKAGPAPRADIPPEEGEEEDANAPVPRRRRKPNRSGAGSQNRRMSYSDSEAQEEVPEGRH